MARLWHETDILTMMTFDPLGAAARLSWNNRVAPRAELEPAAYCLGGSRSIRLSYRGFAPPYDLSRTAGTAKPSL